MAPVAAPVLVAGIAAAAAAAIRAFKTRNALLRVLIASGAGAAVMAWALHSPFFAVGAVFSGAGACLACRPALRPQAAILPAATVAVSILLIHGITTWL